MEVWSREPGLLQVSLRPRGKTVCTTFHALLRCFSVCFSSPRLEKSSQVRTVSSSNLFFKGSRFRYRYFSNIQTAELAFDAKNIANTMFWQCHDNTDDALTDSLPLCVFSAEKLQKRWWNKVPKLREILLRSTGLGFHMIFHFNLIQQRIQGLHWSNYAWLMTPPNQPQKLLDV